MSDSKKLILKGFVFTSLGLIFSKIFIYGWRIVAARVGVEEYGMLSIVLALMGFLIPISALGLGAAIERYVSFYIGKNDIVGVRSTIVNSLKVSVFISIFVTILLFFFSDFLAVNIFKNPELGVLLKLFSLFLPLLVLDQLMMPLFRIYNRLDYFTFVKYILEASLKFSLALLLIYLGYGIFGVAFAHLASISISAILLFYFSRKHCFDFFKKEIKIKNNINELLKYSLPLVIGGFAGFILSATDTLMIGYFKDSVQVGIYNAAYPTATFLMILSSALLAVFLPIITKNLARNNLKEIRIVYYFVTKWIFVLNFFICLVVFYYSDNIIFFLFGSEYLPGGLVLKILAISMFVNSLFAASGSILQMYKKTKIIMYILLFSAVLNVFLNYYLIPQYSILGATISTFLSTIVINMLFQYYTTKYLGIFPISKEIIYATIFTIIMFFGFIEIIHMVLGTFSIYFEIILLFIIGIFYITILYIFKVITLNEFTILLKMLKIKS